MRGQGAENNLTDTLRKAKGESEYPLWLKTDTHWSGVGAYYAYRATMEHLGLPFLGLDEITLADAPLEIEGVWHRTGNLAGFLGVGGLMPETWIGYVPTRPRAKTTKDYPPPSHHVGDVNVPFATAMEATDRPSALLIGDSFRWTLTPLFSESFREIVYTDFRYCFFDPAFADTIDPDVIIFLMTERQLSRDVMPPRDKTW